MSNTAEDFTPTGIKIEGQYENHRNRDNSEVFKAIIREAFGVTDVICGHHLVYQIEEKRDDGFVYTMVEEVPSADTLIFDHDVACKIWGESFKTVLVRLALEPIASRDALLSKLYRERNTNGQG